MAKAKNSDSIKTNLEELENIARWFESDNAFNLEEGIEKVKKASEIIRVLKYELKGVENEFKILRRESASDD